MSHYVSLCKWKSDKSKCTTNNQMFDLCHNAEYRVNEEETNKEQLVVKEQTNLGEQKGIYNIQSIQSELGYITCCTHLVCSMGLGHYDYFKLMLSCC